MTTSIAIAIFALLGLAVGSFLNVCIDRLPTGKSIIRLPSHCESCNQKLRARDLVPLFSYLWLRGHCRYCGAKIPLRLPLVELATALIFASLTWHYGPGLQLAIALIYSCLFLVIFAIDLERRLILDIVVYPAMVLALIFSSFWNGFSQWPSPGILNALLGGAVGFGFMGSAYLIALWRYRSVGGGMGLGDVTLAGLIGIVTGFPLVFVALLLGILSGGVVAISLLIVRLRRGKDPIPFGPFLAVATMVALLWGQGILDWYTGLL
ncbi:MAG: prepilin peptidase [Dehalococcoidia bacterium]|nr:prepilin peptidase [Dehalococcoidia bacterium]